MPTYDFALESVLRLRLAERDKCQRDLAEAQRIESQHGAQLARVETERQRAQAQRRATLRSVRIDMPELQACRDYEQDLAKQQEALQQQLSEASDLVGSCREGLQQADRAVRMLERLNDKRQAERQRAIQQQQVRQVQELAGQPRIGL